MNGSAREFESGRLESYDDSPEMKKLLGAIGVAVQVLGEVAEDPRVSSEHREQAQAVAQEFEEARRRL